MLPKPHSLVATGKFGGLSPPKKVQAISISGVFIKFSERQAALHTRKAPLLMTFWRRFWTSLCRPRFLTTENRRLRNSDLGLSLHAMRLCQNLLPKGKQCAKFRNDWAIFSKRTNFSEKQVLLFTFHDINVKSKNASLCNPVERPSDCRVR